MYQEIRRQTEYVKSKINIDEVGALQTITSCEGFSFAPVFSLNTIGNIKSYDYCFGNNSKYTQIQKVHNLYQELGRPGAIPQ